MQLFRFLQSIRSNATAQDGTVSDASEMKGDEFCYEQFILDDGPEQTAKQSDVKN